MAPLRVGIVDYLNSRPLAWSFLRNTAGKGFEPVLLPPAQVADALGAGSLDVGLIPSIEVQRIPGLTILPGLCVAATREVRSVLLLSRGPANEIRRLALDQNSRTSAVLVQILLREKYGITPQCITVAPRLEVMMSQADAALVIGDPALRVDRRGLQVHDLASEWRQLTDRPFVFAVWAVRRGIGLGQQQEVFHRSLRAGMAEMDTLVEEAAIEMAMEPAAINEYLTDCLSFRLGREEEQGLERFFAKAHAHGMIAELRPLEFIDT